jgi:hypothetical protein
LWDIGKGNYVLVTMAKHKIILKNDLVNKKVKVTEGNAGVVRMLKTLEPGQSYKIENDSNATYREYIFITLPDESPLRVVSSDDFAEFKEISIYERDGVFDWMGIPRVAYPAPADPAAPTPTPTPTPSWKARIRKWFSM